MIQSNENNTTPEFEEVPGVRVGETAYGFGVFATRFFSAGQSIGKLLGKFIDGEDYEGSEYAIELNEHLTMEPGPPFRFLNHGCEPNCCLVIHETEDEDGVITFESAQLEVIAAVHPGDELTIDYGWNAESAIPCHCGAVRCRKWVVCEHELERVRELKRDRA